ncbi:MAG: DUF6527 family protein [Sinimarinibacterium sp.]|jgi:hypothetical protein
MKIRFVANLDAPDRQPGDAVWLSSGGTGVSDAQGNPVPVREHSALAYTCPGCNLMGAVNVRPAPSDRHSWEWDGNAESPTLKPSLHHVGCCGWHGYLTAGVFTAC